MDQSIKWRAAAGAGIVAGILATAAQIVLWLLFTDALPAILFRDARFTAAIVMGRGVLPPPSSLELNVMLIAGVVHLALSIAYGLLASRVIVHL